jgi:hypothetical protein
MRDEGASIYGIDGNYPGLFGEKISLPPQIMRHRPDAIGLKADGQVFIGEAKTEQDISNNRTYEQIQDFSSIELNGKLCEVFIGVPLACEEHFNRSMKRLGLKGAPNIHVLVIPNEIINE